MMIFPALRFPPIFPPTGSSKLAPGAPHMRPIPSSYGLLVCVFCARSSGESGDRTKKEGEKKEGKPVETGTR